MSQNQNINDTNLLLKNISEQDFQNLGNQEVAYIKPTLVHNKMMYVIHAANGKPLSAVEKLDDAISTIWNNDLETVSLQ